MADPPRSAGLSTEHFQVPGTVAGTLALVRHGESTWVAEGRFQGRGDPPLSELGTRQARALAQRLAPDRPALLLGVPTGPPAAIWHSPLDRARQTAELIVARQPPGVRLVADEHFTEIAQGAWEGLLHDEVVARDAKLLAGWRREPRRFHAPGGESLDAAAARVRAGLASLLGALPGHGSREPRSSVPGYAVAASRPWTLLVAHDGVLRITLLTLLDLPLERFWAVPFQLCAVSLIDLSAGRASLRAHNLVDHLAAVQEQPRVPEEAGGDRRGAL